MPIVRRVVTSTSEPLYNEGDALVKSPDGRPTYGMTEADLATAQLAAQQQAQAQRAAEIVNAARNSGAITYGGNQGTVPVMSDSVRLTNMAQGAPRRVHTYGAGYPGWSNWAGDNYRGEFVGFPDAVPHVLYGGMMDTLAPYMQSLAPFLAAAMQRRAAAPVSSTTTTTTRTTTPGKQRADVQKKTPVTQDVLGALANKDGGVSYGPVPPDVETPVAVTPVATEPTFDMPMVDGFDNDADYVNGEYDIIETAPISPGDAASAFGKAAALAGSIWSLANPRSILDAGKWLWNLNRAPAAVNAGSKVFNPQGVQMSQSLIGRMQAPVAKPVTPPSSLSQSMTPPRVGIQRGVVRPRSPQRPSVLNNATPQPRIR